MPDPQNTGEAIAAARRLVAETRLKDPGEHFPYKRKAVDALLANDAPLGPSGKDDDSVTVRDFMSPRIAAATDAYIEAQAAYLMTDTRADRELYDQARDELLAARRAHRRYRTDVDGNPVLNVTANSPSVQQDHLRGTRFRRPGEE